MQCIFIVNYKIIILFYDDVLNKISAHHYYLDHKKLMLTKLASHHNVDIFIVDSLKLESLPQQFISLCVFIQRQR